MYLPEEMDSHYFGISSLNLQIYLRNIISTIDLKCLKSTWPFPFQGSSFWASLSIQHLFCGDGRVGAPPSDWLNPHNSEFLFPMEFLSVERRYGIAFPPYLSSAHPILEIVEYYFYAV